MSRSQVTPFAQRPEDGSDLIGGAACCLLVDGRDRFLGTGELAGLDREWCAGERDPAPARDRR
ncbi:hypothetical protein ACQP0C_15045 [Nocardia sp. CA-129566]|uniref:hypothetical protein n=1 Tax=Nocardia sp. CA-129566 TaxID=3239976 RepID=UPI003D998F2C